VQRIVVLLWAVALPWLPCAPTSAQADAIVAIRAALEQARFEEADQLTRALLLRADLDARTRNEGLELSAIAQIARRDELGAMSTLSLLYARDPEHPRHVLDPGPSVDAAFSRARRSPPSPIEVKLDGRVSRDRDGRDVAELTLGAGEAVQSVHVFVHDDNTPSFVEVVAKPSQDGTVRVVLPALPRSLAQGDVTRHWYAEARAPSGFTLARLASAEHPLSAQLLGDVLTERCAPPKAEPLGRKWWVWTTVGMVVSSVVIAGAVAGK
jgi:hypothetical protein